MEGESEESINTQIKLFHKERALPDLASNIKCGNSLIGPDFYDNEQMELFDEEERLRINVFDWKAEFPKIMKRGGFDAVIGNPPYVRIGTIDEGQRPYLYAKYDVEHRFDIYVVFIQRSYELLKSPGRLGFIVPNKFFTANYGESLRDYLGSRKAIASIVDFGDTQVFDRATTYTCLLLLSTSPQSVVAYHPAVATTGSMSIDSNGTIALPVQRLQSDPWVFLDEESWRLRERLSKHPPLGDFCNIDRGLETGADDVFLLTRAVGDSGSCEKHCVIVRSKADSNPFPIEREAIRPLLKDSVDIRRYYIEESSRFVLFPYEHIDGTATVISESELARRYPMAWEYVHSHEPFLRTKKKTCWYAFRRRNYDLKDGVPRILIPSIGTRACFSFDGDGKYHFVGSGGGGGGGYGVALDNSVEMSPYCFLGILNSKLIDWFVKGVNSRFGHGYYSFNRQYIEPLPIRPIDVSCKTDRAQHDAIVALAREMSDLQNNVHHNARTSHEQTALQRQIDATDRRIDALVYQLYGLTDDEIRIVEEATGAP